MENQSKFKTSKDMINYLATTFPHCFSIEGEAKPLKIGIFHDLVARLGDNTDISKVKLRAALRTYTSSWRYLHGIKEGASRVSLEGDPCGILTAEHVMYAQKKLKEGKAKVKAKRLEKKKQSRSSHHNNSSVLIEKPSHQHKTQPKKINSSSANKIKPASQPVDVHTLKIGDEVKINLSSKPVKAVLVAIEKESIRVKIQSGMEVIVNARYLIK